MTWLVEVLITATSSEYLAGTKRLGRVVVWAKAEEAKAKAKMIDSKGSRYVSIKRVSIKSDIRQSHRELSMANLWKAPI